MVKIQMKTYSELITYRTFKERLDYLRVTSPIGIDSFGYDRYLNQFFYIVQNGFVLEIKLLLEIMDVI